jgi:hypothetical protein
MAKRVLVPIDLPNPTPWAAFYGVQLAARLNAAMTLMAVSPEGAEGTPPSLASLHGDQRLWVEQVVHQCQQERVSLEIFFARGPFFQEISRFVRSQAGIHFVVLGVPNHLSPKSYQAFAVALKLLHEQLPEEILLVREKGEITRLPQPSSPNPGREK